MDRINTTSAVPDGNGPGKAGFRDGNLAGGIVPTSLNAAWFNQMQEEIANTIEGAGITLDPDDKTQLLAAIDVLTGSGRLLALQTITASGTYTPPAGARRLRIRGCGAGGGSAGAAATGAGTVSFGTGGMSGAYAEFWTDAVSASVTVGAAGAAGSAGGNGGNGGASAWGTLVTLAGGIGGAAQGPVVPPYVAIASGSAAIGGSLTPTVAIPGTPGSAGVASTTTAFISGGGGMGPLGQAGAPTQNGDGIYGSGYGVGASGASNTASAAARPGGLGTPGVFIVEAWT